MPVLVFIALAAAVADEPKQSQLVAQISGQPVYAAEVEAELRRAYGDTKLSAGERARLGKAALNQVIDRRLVLAALTKSGEAATKQDVDLALAQFETELKAQNLTLQQHCQKVGLTSDDIRRSLAWKLSWKRYTNKYLTPQNLEKYFDRNRREFDGTQLRLAQILIKLPEEADDAAVNAAKARAAEVRQAMSSGKPSFAEAAKQFSEAPSSQAGGDIGWIERHQPMPEDYSRAAFTLKKGDVSEPVISPFGVHLIMVLEEKPGSKTWREAEAELKPAVTLYLFRWLADKERAAVKIEYVDAAKP
jgi:peptidyl-prolyl cis-trans isomerase C